MSAWTVTIIQRISCLLKDAWTIFV